MTSLGNPRTTQGSPSTPGDAIYVSHSVPLETSAPAQAGGSPPPSTSRALRVVARQFVGLYYDDLNADATRVKRFYTEDSVFTVEDDSTPRRTGDSVKQSENKNHEADFYDGPESPTRRLATANPTVCGVADIIKRRNDLFANRHATVVSTDVQTVPGGNVLAVVLGTLSSSSFRATATEVFSDEKKEITFMQSFVLGRRRPSEAFGDVTGNPNGAIPGDLPGDGTDVQKKLAHVPGEVDAESPPADFLDFVIVAEVFRKIDPVAKRSPAATAATVLAAAMSPPGTPPRLNKAVPVDTVSHGAYDQTDTPSRIGDGNGKGFPNAATPTPRKSPNPFNDESELVSPGDGVHGRDGGTRFRSGGEGVGQKVHAPDDFAASASSPSHLDAGMSKQSETNNQNQKVRPASPDARAIPLPSFGLLNAHTGPGSGAGSDERPDQKRSASKYDPRHDDDGARRILAFEHARGDVSPWHRDDHRNDGGHARSIHSSSRGSIRDRHDRQRVYSSASSSPAMRVMGHGGSVQSTPGEYADGNAHLDSDGNLDHTESPHAKRGLGFVERPLSHQTDAVRWDHERRSPQLTRLVTLSERSDEGSQGAHSMSVSVSSQPSASGRGSEDGDRESLRENGFRGTSYLEHGFTENDGSLQEFPLDELEPVNLDDVRRLSVRHDAQRRGVESGHSSYRSSPVATPSRGARRRDEFKDERDLEYRDSYGGDSILYGGNGTSRQHQQYPPPVNNTRYPRDQSYDSRGYVTRGYHSARASPVVSREGGSRFDYRRQASRSNAGSTAGGSAATSPAVSRQGSRPHGFRGDANVAQNERSYEYAATRTFARPPRRRFDSAPPSPSMGATRRTEFGAVPRNQTSRSRLSSASGTRRDPVYRVVGVTPSGQTIVTHKTAPEEQLDVAVNYLSMLTAALHFTSVFVGFCVLCVCVASNQKSARRVALRLNRIDEAVLMGRTPSAMNGNGNGDAPGGYYHGSGRTAGRANRGGAPAEAYASHTTSHTRGYSLPVSGVDAAYASHTTSHTRGYSLPVSGVDAAPAPGTPEQF